MNKICVSNLALIVTNKCNLDCAHCMRGRKNNKDMTNEVIESTLNQLRYIQVLNICGGEPTLAVDTIRYIFEYILKNKIIVDKIFITINGTNYSTSLLELCKDMKKYADVKFAISYDKYHVEQLYLSNLYNKYIENVKKYEESRYYEGLRILNPKLKLFREGNAEKIDSSLTVDLKKLNYFITYVDNKMKMDRENGLCYIGPIITINTDGIITECDASIEHQSILYNYGNVLNDSIEEISLKRGKVLKPKSWIRKCNRVDNIYKSYN